MSQFLKTISFAALVALAGPALAQENETADTSGASETSEPAAPDAASDLDLGAQPESPASEAPGSEAPTAEAGVAAEDTPEEGPGSTYTAAEFGDWQQRCARAAEGTDPCQLYQLLQDGNGNSVAEISIFPLPAGQEAAAGATIVTPLETLLPAGITLTVDGGQPRRYPFEFCAAQGCIARVGFTNAEVAQFKQGANGNMVIRPAAAPDQQIELTISLSGFTAGYEAVQETVPAE
ncbi:Invasion protein IalB, involved in pathogenesis [Palleronia marisminoris]|uniref:Invasion associated locus B (IalB) protein n=1 Tax=Palleronia marisminoris TaxID=315423 RepID=A0A1Y5RHZ4_9RHOB|nr:invasion associated locus B family protein [Palleronia marisminoris]SFG21763.1 Invasion protein IalB, involved in pathogenesis [Palleronia marisminoris]SLN17579.1 Invasion associated locus B (IalB) protein [Palleronia marisminoris]